MIYDYIIVGAGFAGSVLAERLASVLDKKVLIIEQRPHIGGNCYDYYDEHGVLVHKYGPHLFHTDNKDVIDYLSQFTQWQEYEHRVLASIDGQLVPVPFNLISLQKLFPTSMANSLEQKLIKNYGFGAKVSILELRKTKDQELNKLAEFVYEKMFINYTTKQWGCTPEEISPEVTARIPVYISYDDRYFQDKYQMIPRQGYTKLFQNILNHRNIHIMLNTDFKDIIRLNHNDKSLTVFRDCFEGKLIYSGMIDELFNFKFGELPYRSLQFKMENLSVKHFQKATTVNYPNNYDFTRITEFKNILNQDINSTTIVREYPQDFERKNPDNNIPYYPVFKKENNNTLKIYNEYCESFQNIIAVGRLAEYKYYDMDDIIARSLDVFDNIVDKLGK